jgi:hypothetical protein
MVLISLTKKTIISHLALSLNKKGEEEILRHIVFIDRRLPGTCQVWERC